MELSLPHDTWGKGSSLELMWSRPIESGRHAGVVVAATASVMLLLTGLVALMRVRRRRGTDAAYS
jgi:hypothetical protein